MSVHQSHVDLSLGAFDLPHHGLLVRFPLPDIFPPLEPFSKSESVWFLPDSHAAAAPVGTRWQTDQYCSIQGPLLGESIFSRIASRLLAL